MFVKSFFCSSPIFMKVSVLCVGLRKREEVTWCGEPTFSGGQGLRPWVCRFRVAAKTQVISEESDEKKQAHAGRGDTIYCRLAGLICCRVSIPFKREGAFKAVKDPVEATKDEKDHSFNSLQAGRGIQRIFLRKKEFTHMNLIVSIPFKREGAFKDHAEIGTTGRDSDNWFQFPSSGKGHSKNFFKKKGVHSHESHRFNSLQAGRGIQSLLHLRSVLPRRGTLQFQFPSSGKGHSKMEEGELVPGDFVSVSIPFKREGAFKVSRLWDESLCNHVSIPFKREGAFKGKKTCRRTDRVYFRFNSLQAGRGIQSVG